VRIGKLLLYWYNEVINTVMLGTVSFGMVAFIALWLSLTIGIIVFEHITNYKGSKVLYNLLTTLSNIISFGRKPKFKRKLNLKTLTYRKSGKHGGNNVNAIYVDWIRAMTSHISDTCDNIPKINQMDHYAVAMSNVIRFDSDSSPIKIDNCCTQTISGFREDFIPTTLKQVEHLHVNGFGNTRTAITHKGTVKWVVIDDSGQHRDILIPNTYYVPNCGTRLLSPQHWAQEVQDNFPSRDGTWCATFNDRVVLEWNQRKYTKTIQINPDKSNVAIMWTIDGTKRYNKFASMIHKYAMDTTIWEDNNDEETNSAISPVIDNTVVDVNEGAWDIINKVS
jgi:hypothetical protein